MSVVYWYRLEAWMRAPTEHETRMSKLAAFWLAFAILASGIALYAWQIFVEQSAWSVLFWLVAISAAATASMWKLKIQTFVPSSFFYLMVIALIAIELFWVIGFTTFGFATKGLLWASGVWYSWWMAVLIQEKEIKTRTVLKGTTLLFASWILIFLVIRWF